MIRHFAVTMSTIVNNKSTKRPDDTLCTLQLPRSKSCSTTVRHRHKLLTAKILFQQPEWETTPYSLRIRRLSTPQSIIRVHSHCSAADDSTSICWIVTVFDYKFPQRFISRSEETWRTQLFVTAFCTVGFLACYNPHYKPGVRNVNCRHGPSSS